MIDDLASAAILTFAVVASLMGALWLASVYLRDASIADRFWGFGFCVIAVTLAVAGAGWPPRQSLILAMVLLWGLRLTAYLTWRNWGGGEDYRYRAMRARHGAQFPLRSLFTVFALQGMVMWLISMPAQSGLVETGATHFTAFDALGLGLWLVGFSFEAIGDWQLAKFKADPANAGKVMDRGLWRYTRHPNYFGEAVLWWGIWLVSCSTPHGPWTMLSPTVMTLLLLRVSGVALLERHLHESRPGYREYVERTSAFFPAPPKKRLRIDGED